MTAVVTPSGFELAARPRRRPAFSVEPVSIAWDAVAFSVRGSRDAVACVPRRSLASFLADLDDGRLDEAIESFLASEPSGRVLRAAGQTGRPGLFDSISAPDAIVASERVPGRVGVLSGAGGGTPLDARQNKDRLGPRRPRRPGLSRRVLVGAGAAVATVTVAAIAVVAAQGGGDDQPVTAAAPSTVPRLETTAPATVPPSTLLTASPRCGEEPGLTSDNGDTPATITFVNNTNQTMRAYWIDYDGARIFYSEVPARQTVNQPTFVTHPWVLADTSDRCLSLDIVTGPTASLSVPQR